jgi:hypothetical protein
VYERVQRLDATIEHLGDARHIADVGDRQSRVAQRARGAAGGEQFVAPALQAASEGNQAGFVGNANQNAWHEGVWEARRPGAGSSLQKLDRPIRDSYPLDRVG